MWCVELNPYMILMYWKVRVDVGWLVSNYNYKDEQLLQNLNAWHSPSHAHKSDFISTSFFFNPRLVHIQFTPEIVYIRRFILLNTRNFRCLILDLCYDKQTSCGTSLKLNVNFGKVWISTASPTRSRRLAERQPDLGSPDAFLHRGVDLGR